jgi:excinuclease UvrABC helicase subunit UvrB
VQKAKEFIELASIENIEGYIKQRELDMKRAAKALNFEEAAMIRDEIRELKRL